MLCVLLAFVACYARAIVRSGTWQSFFFSLPTDMRLFVVVTVEVSLVGAVVRVAMLGKGRGHVVDTIMQSGPSSFAVTGLVYHATRE